MSKQAGRVEYLCSPDVIGIREISLRKIRSAVFGIYKQLQALFDTLAGQLREEQITYRELHSCQWVRSRSGFNT